MENQAFLSLKKLKCWHLEKSKFKKSDGASLGEEPTKSK